MSKQATSLVNKTLRDKGRDRKAVEGAIHLTTDTHPLEATRITEEAKDIHPTEVEEGITTGDEDKETSTEADGITTTGAVIMGDNPTTQATRQKNGKPMKGKRTDNSETSKRLTLNPPLRHGLKGEPDM